jgi:hypothetical protein
MSPCDAPPVTPSFTAEEARIRVGTALSLLELAAQVLDELPPPETAFPPGDRQLHRYLAAAEAAKCWLVGHEVGDSVDRPGRPSALGDGQRTYEWSEEEAERHFREAMQDWSERQ